FIYWISCRKISFRSSIIYSIIAASLLLTGGLVLLQNNTANKALHIWFFDRMMHRIASDPVTQNHFYILKGLLMEQLPAIILCVFLLVVFRAKKTQNEFGRENFVFFFLLGCSGSLPLMLTLVQRDFYFTPALPLFAIAW